MFHCLLKPTASILRRIFKKKNNWLQNDKGTIHLKEQKACVMEQVFKFLYRFQTTEFKSMVYEIYSAADMISKRIQYNQNSTDL